MNLKQDRQTLRELTYKYFEIAHCERNRQKIELHKAVNDLRMKRPVVLIDELPWNEMNIGDELTLKCENKFLREVEWYLRSTIYRDKYFPADMIVPPYIPVSKIIDSTGIGISVEEETLSVDQKNHIKSHDYKDILKTEEDLAQIHNPEISYNREKTIERYNLLGDMIGDIIPVKITGISYYGVMTWDDIARYRGVNNLLVDLIDRPDFMHKIAARLTETKLSYLKQVEELGLFDNDPYDLHCTPAKTDDLPGDDFEVNNLTRENVWGRGAAQIFSSVSKEMHKEFDIEYMKKTVGQCGLVYYGCCEALDEKIDIVEKIPNLRKISISPWADVNAAAEAINEKYVLSAKPNPSVVSGRKLNEKEARNELETIIQASKKYNCSCDIVLKDISSCAHRPQNIFEWEQIAMEMVRNF